jgi:hypothetical protein
MCFSASQQSGSHRFLWRLKACGCNFSNPFDFFACVFPIPDEDSECFRYRKWRCGNFYWDDMFDWSDLEELATLISRRSERNVAGSVNGPLVRLNAEHVRLASQETARQPGCFAWGNFNRLHRLKHSDVILARRNPDQALSASCGCITLETSN